MEEGEEGGREVGRGALLVLLGGMEGMGRMGIGLMGGLDRRVRMLFCRRVSLSLFSLSFFL
jgi:hypothetical protein